MRLRAIGEGLVVLDWFCHSVASVSRALAVDMPCWTFCVHALVVPRPASVFQPLAMDMPCWTFCLQVASMSREHEARAQRHIRIHRRVHTSHVRVPLKEMQRRTNLVGLGGPLV